MKESNIVTKVANTIELAKKPEEVKKLTKYGKVPVFYLPIKAALKKVPDPGLKQLISQAMTKKEIENLLNKGKTEYKTAQKKTIRKWELAAKERLKELQNKK